MPTRNSALIFSAACTCGESLQSPSGIDGSCGACGWMKRLAEEEGEAGAEQHQRDADGDVVDARQRAQQAVEQRRAARRAAAPRSTPSQGEPVR